MFFAAPIALFFYVYFFRREVELLSKFIAFFFLQIEYFSFVSLVCLLTVTSNLL